MKHGFIITPQLSSNMQWEDPENVKIVSFAGNVMAKFSGIDIELH